jgi:hypothetical protein
MSDEEGPVGEWKGLKPFPDSEAGGVYHGAHRCWGVRAAATALRKTRRGSCLGQTKLVRSTDE